MGPMPLVSDQTPHGFGSRPWTLDEMTASKPNCAEDSDEKHPRMTMYK